MTSDRVRAANRSAFAELVARPERELDLMRGALLIASAGRPFVDADVAVRELDQLAERVHWRADGRLPPPGRLVVDDDDRAALLEHLHDVLYRRAGFRAPGPAAGTAPGHSLMDQVMATKVGLPINLAIVELEVARRVGLPLHGVGLPGHFIVGGPDGLLVDPAAGGRRLTRDDCQALIRRALARPLLLQDAMLRPVSRRQILGRVLRNLRVARIVARDWPAALAAIELLDAIIDAARQGGAAADTLIARYFASRRYAGSKDRRAVRDLVYAAIRSIEALQTVLSPVTRLRMEELN